MATIFIIKLQGVSPQAKQGKQAFDRAAKQS